MQNEIATRTANVALSGRSVAEITADIQINYRNAKASILQIGRDLAEVKQMLQHGEWLPYLEKLDISVSSAEKYIRYAAEVADDSQLASLPYSAAMAMIALPEPERQKVQEQDLDGKSAAEIKRLIAEVKAEKKRADDAERRADEGQKALDSTTEDLKRSIRELEERPVIRETVAPDDYDELKESVEKLREELLEAEDAAADAEERANAAVAQAQRAAMAQLDAADPDEGQGDGRPSLSDFIAICNDFQSKVWAVPFMQDEFRNLSDRDLNSYRLFTNGVKTWAERVLSAMDEATAPIPAEGVIIIDEE